MLHGGAVRESDWERDLTIDGTSQWADVIYHVSTNQGMRLPKVGFKGLGKRNLEGGHGDDDRTARPAVRFTILDPDGAEGFPGRI